MINIHIGSKSDAILNLSQQYTHSVSRHSRVLLGSDKTLLGNADERFTLHADRVEQ